MVAVVQALCLGACQDKGENDAPAATETPITGTIDASRPETPPIIDAAPVVPPKRVYQIQDNQLEEVLADGSRTRLAPAVEVSFCALDPGAESVWLLDDQGLQLFDLRSKELLTIVKGDIDSIDIRFGDEIGQLGNIQQEEELVALVLMATRSPELRSDVLCNEDRQAQCYQESESDDPMQWELVPAVTMLQKRHKKLQLLEVERLTDLAKRREAWHEARDDKSLLTTPPPPPGFDIRALFCGAL